MNRLIAFDIDTIVTSKILENVSQIYDHIKQYMLANGFEWRQGSVYISKEPMSYNTVVHLVNNMYNNYPYMKKCVRLMLTSEVPVLHSLEHLGDYDGTPGKFAKENTVQTKKGPIPKDEFDVNYVLKNGKPEFISKDAAKVQEKTRNEISR